MTYLITHRWRLIEHLVPMGILSKLWVHRTRKRVLAKAALAVFCWFRSRAYHEDAWEEYREAGLL